VGYFPWFKPKRFDSLLISSLRVTLGLQGSYQHAKSEGNVAGEILKAARAYPASVSA
jgi:hypothetical protein